MLGADGCRHQLEPILDHGLNETEPILQRQPPPHLQLDSFRNFGSHGIIVPLTPASDNTHFRKRLDGWLTHAEDHVTRIGKAYPPTLSTPASATACTSGPARG